ncbi:uncharacterized protein LOC141684458 [Apium graveolens]|uniref:uncharacterized protein LOC141684458 n=1 Tax=Apium graveolens TaxID=4045 RepID=UPI003D797E1B
MEETSEEKVVVVVVKPEKRNGDYHDHYSCSNILFCKYSLHEVVRAIFCKCFGFETSTEPDAAVATPDVKEGDPPEPSSTTQPVPQPCPSSTPQPTEDMTMRFRPPPRRPPTRGSGPETNSSGNS